MCFRNLKQATDDALIMFSDKEAKNVVVVSPYEQVIKLYESAVNNLLNITPTCQSVDDLYGESEKESFVYAFRDVMRLNNRLKCIQSTIKMLLLLQNKILKIIHQNIKI